MASTSRSAVLTRLHKVLKKHYKPTAPAGDRQVLEHLLFACCLENAPYDAAEQSFAAVVSSFFDLNEIRVSTIRELSEVMHHLPDPRAASLRLKGVLQHVFETSYSFEIEGLKKLTLGQAVQKLEGMKGATPFAVAYVTQATLGGHAIPIDSGALQVLYIVGAISEEERKKGSVPGLERAIPKAKGHEFGSLLHQLSAELVVSPYSPNVHKVLLEIDPTAKPRLPKRGGRPKSEPAPASKTAHAEAAAKSDKPRPAAAAKSEKAPDKSTKKPAKAAAKPASAPKKAPPRKPAAKGKSSAAPKRKPR